MPKKEESKQKESWLTGFKRNCRHIRNSYNLLSLFVRKIKAMMQKDEALARSPGVTYYFIMGFVPFLIFVSNAITITHLADIDKVLELVQTYTAPRMAEVLTPEIERLVEKQSNIWMWISLMASSYSFAQGLSILIRTTDPIAYDHSEKRLPLITERRSLLVYVKSVLLSFGLVISIIMSLGIMVFGDFIVSSIGHKISPEFAMFVTEGWYKFTYGIPLLSLITYLTIFYLSAPKSYTPRLHQAAPTAFFVTLLWILSTLIYSWVLELLPGIGAYYGALFGFFAMFLWFSYIATIIILGIYLVRFWFIFWQRLVHVRRIFF